MWSGSWLMFRETCQMSPFAPRGRQGPWTFTIFGETHMWLCCSRLNTVTCNWFYYIAGACRGTEHHDQPLTDATTVLNFIHTATAEGVNSTYRRTRRYQQLAYKTVENNKHTLTYLMYLLNYSEKYKWILRSNFHHFFFFVSQTNYLFF